MSETRARGLTVAGSVLTLLTVHGMCSWFVVIPLFPSWGHPPIFFYPAAFALPGSILSGIGVHYYRYQHPPSRTARLARVSFLVAGFVVACLLVYLVILPFVVYSICSPHPLGGDC